MSDLQQWFVMGVLVGIVVGSLSMLSLSIWVVSDKKTVEDKEREVAQRDYIDFCNK